MKNKKLDVEKLVKKYLPKEEKFVAGKTYIPASGKVFGIEEVSALVEASLDFTHTITEGAITKDFESKFSKYLGVRCSSFCNSGSSANLLAFMALTSPKLGSKALQVGDEVITSSVGFPTTVAPIIHFGCVPVYVDVSLSTYNPTSRMIAEAITDKTRAIFLAHTLGNPLNMEEIMDIAIQNTLWVISDICDGLGGEFGGKMLGTFGDFSTFSFYPAHQMTTGEGGMVSTNSPMLNSIVRSFRDWGRDCFCAPGKDNTCGKRFSQKVHGKLPEGFDHKYIYSHVGYNLKSTDLQASIGLEQLKKLPSFVDKRQHNWEYLSRGFLRHRLDNYFTLPSCYNYSRPSWFGFALTIRDNARFTRSELVQYLETHKIGTRNIFAGNITKQPGFMGKGRIADIIPKADIVMERSFWIGVYPGITDEMNDWILECFVNFVSTR